MNSEASVLLKDKMHKVKGPTAIPVDLTDTRMDEK